MTVHTISSHLKGIDSLERGIFSTRSLEKLLEQVDKILLHMDGMHGVQRDYCDARTLVERARSENSLLLDLGHIVRMYFGDDYFDLHLNSKMSSERPASISALVDAVKEEIDSNLQD